MHITAHLHHRHCIDATERQSSFYCILYENWGTMHNTVLVTRHLIRLPEITMTMEMTLFESGSILYDSRHGLGNFGIYYIFGR